MVNKLLELLVNINSSSGLVKLAILVTVILVLAFLIDFLLSHSILGIGYRIFAAPGIIIHESAHAIMCLVTGAKITKVSFFAKDGGSVQHAPSKIPIIGAILISMAPFAAGAVVIYFLSRKLGLSGVDMHAVDLSKGGIINFISSELKSIDYHSILNIVIVYLVLTTAVTMTPSLQDLRNIITSLISVGVILYLLERFAKVSFSHFVIPDQILTLLLTVIFLLILGFILSIVVFGISKVFKPL